MLKYDIQMFVATVLACSGIIDHSSLRNQHTHSIAESNLLNDLGKSNAHLQASDYIDRIDTPNPTSANTTENKAVELIPSADELSNPEIITFLF